MPQMIDILWTVVKNILMVLVVNMRADLILKVVFWAGCCYYTGEVVVRQYGKN